ncbi:type II toxin-antitoxin system RelE family toxin [Subtercola lobariae]|uniref:Translation repressor RelE n=1 Tax=Subtercola lobariae TaxID=1588641 RepID=A0A917B1K6_9MICO|nr:type II toxin-antitoxin system RelE/ParE family toxin [Subtercola lobariae]GGF12216.1 translation repressor RelE [Subtercola lobariae]
MTRYVVEFTTAAAKQVVKFDPPVRRRVLAAIESLAVEPRPQASTKLVGEDVAWRLRVGDYRVIYDLVDELMTVTVVRAAHRREVYSG